MVVLAIDVQLPPPLVEYSQFRIDPVWPLRFSVAPFVPEHTVADDEILPPTVVGLTVITILATSTMFVALCAT